MRPLVIYHDNCPDGFAAAWAAWRYFGEEAEYLGASYGEAPPEVAGRDVYIFDFSYAPEVTMEITRKCNLFVMRDHHKTAMDAWHAYEKEHNVLFDADGPHKSIRFDMSKSGATLAWDYFCNPHERSWIVQYAEDRDLWKHALPQSKEVNAYLQAAPKDFKVFDEVHELGAETAAQYGKGCLAWVRYYVDSAKKATIRQRFCGHDNIPVVNAPYTAISEVVGELSEEEGVPFAVGWHMRPHPTERSHIVYSLRSRHGFDVSALAKSLGGGGHVAASGFQSHFFPSYYSEDPVMP